LDLQGGVILFDKEGRRIKGPSLNRENKMTLEEYQKISEKFEIISEE
jgi:hypothetical protein